jgi:hypothetical protein
MMTDSWSVAAARVLDALDEADHAKDRAAMNGR